VVLLRKYLYVIADCCSSDHIPKIVS